MSAVTNRTPIRCFCSFLAVRTNGNVLVCGRYRSAGTICLFHLHDENLDNFYQPNQLPLALDCEMCLATIKIHSREYIAPCRVPFVRCYCDDVATFYQSKKDNSNHGMYFFGCPNWKTENCKYFYWSHEYQTTRNVYILRGLYSPAIPQKQIHQEQPHQHALEQADDAENMNKEDMQKKIRCTICLSGEKTFMMTPCNHLCCCSKCARRIENQCPMCREPIQSIQRVFLA